MRKRYAPLGWPRRDPRHYRFPIPNVVWTCKLKPIEFVVFSYLCYHYTHGQDGIPAVEVVAESVHLTADTVKKYLDALVNRGLITAEWSFVSDLQCANGKKFFTLPNEVFLLKVSPSAFMVYAYLLLIENRRKHTCHPSYNTIADATGLSRNTVMKSICNLLEAELITMEHSSYFDKRGLKWNGNNLYTILPVSTAVDQIHQRQLRQLELDVERRYVRKRQEEYDRRDHRRPRMAQNEGRKEKQDKSRTPQAAPGKTTSARSAGS